MGKSVENSEVEQMIHIFFSIFIQKGEKTKMLLFLVGKERWNYFPLSIPVQLIFLRKLCHTPLLLFSALEQQVIYRSAHQNTWITFSCLCANQRTG